MKAELCRSIRCSGGHLFASSTWCEWELHTFRLTAAIIIAYKCIIKLHVIFHNHSSFTIYNTIYNIYICVKVDIAMVLKLGYLGHPNLYNAWIVIMFSIKCCNLCSIWFVLIGPDLSRNKGDSHCYWRCDLLFKNVSWIIPIQYVWSKNITFTHYLPRKSENHKPGLPEGEIDQLGWGGHEDIEGGDVSLLQWFGGRAYDNGVPQLESRERRHSPGHLQEAHAADPLHGGDRQVPGLLLLLPWDTPAAPHLRGLTTFRPAGPRLVVQLYRVPRG